MTSLYYNLGKIIWKNNDLGWKLMSTIYNILVLSLLTVFYFLMWKNLSFSEAHIMTYYEFKDKF